MNIEIFANGKAIDNIYYRLQWQAGVEWFCPECRIWGPLAWLETMKAGQSLRLNGDGQRLFTGEIRSVAEVERSRVLVVASEPLGEELLLNFHKEQSSNILQEVWPEYNTRVADFEVVHYSLKGSIYQHLILLKNRLEKHSKKRYWWYLDAENKLQIHQAYSGRGQAEITGTLISRGDGYQIYKLFAVGLGMASPEGIAERLELVIDGVKEQLTVWWGQSREQAE